MGFRDSPHFFGQAMAKDLVLYNQGSSTLLQYVDDHLLCSPSLEASQSATAALLNFLGDKGYRVSPAKAQLSSPQVTYLGVLLQPGQKSLTVDRIQALKDLGPPTDADSILSFLGLVGFFRHWIPNFAVIAKPLYQAAKETPKGPLTSPKEVAQAFIRLRDSLTSAPVLSLPNPQRPFHLFTDERQGIAVGLLAQPLGPTHR